MYVAYLNNSGDATVRLQQEGDDATPGIVVFEVEPTDAQLLAAFPALLAKKRERAKARVDAAAETARLQFITPGFGQAMTYMRKLEEARAQQAGGLGPFPLLQAGIGVDGADVAAVAATVIAMSDAWTAVAAAIEAIRLAAKRDIDAVEDSPDAADAIEAIVAACAWPQT
jgi:hypothetical protein